MQKKRKAFLVARHSDVIGRGTMDLIRECHPEENVKVKIELVCSPNVFTPDGLVTLIQQNKDIGIVYVCSEIPPDVIKKAEETGLMFGLLEKDAVTKKPEILFKNPPLPASPIECLA